MLLSKDQNSFILAAVIIILFLILIIRIFSVIFKKRKAEAEAELLARTKTVEGEFVDLRTNEV